MLRFATMDEWWRLTARRPDYRRESHHLLKDYGYLKLIDCVEQTRPSRLLEFGHGFNDTILRRFQDECEVYGIDDYQALPYFPGRAEWEAMYEERLVDPCPRAHLVRGLLGDGDVPELEEGTFDLIASISVLEELDEEAVARVIGHAERLLAPGGLFVGTFDVPLYAPGHTGRLTRSVDASGLQYVEPPAIESTGDFNALLIESPTVVMLTYQMADGDERTFRGHWGSVWFVLQKPDESGRAAA
jgi:SAM-dependent methyltransferase